MPCCCVVQGYINENIIKTPLYEQHAYTKGKSCNTAMSEVVDFIEKNTLRGQHVLAVSLDCSSAFDGIKFDSVDKGMKEMQIPMSIRKLCANILKKRQVSAELQGGKSTRVPTRGSLQSSCLL